MFVNSDFSDLLRIFNDNNVKYLVIGGYAVDLIIAKRASGRPQDLIDADLLLLAKGKNDLPGEASPTPTERNQ
jgi:predicted nucleotidyltransferase